MALALILALLLAPATPALAQNSVYLPMATFGSTPAVAPDSLADDVEAAGKNWPVVTGDVIPVFDYEPPDLPEGIAIDKTGNIFVSLANQSELRKIAPDGTESLLATLPTGGFGLLGLAVDAPGNVYAGLATADGVTNGVYRISPDGTAVRLPGTEAIFIPNALVFDKQGNLYVHRHHPGGRVAHRCRRHGGSVDSR